MKKTGGATSAASRKTKKATTAPRRAVRDPEPLAVASVRTPAGRIVLICSAAGLREVRLGSDATPSRREGAARGVRYIRRPAWTSAARRAIERFVQGGAIPATLPLDLSSGTEFQRRVWDATRRVSWGDVASYTDIAKGAGAPRAVRAVGNALGSNPVPIVVPCHRVIHDRGTIGGFTSGLAWKRYLLSLERGQLELDWKKPRRGVLGLLAKAARTAQAKAKATARATAKATARATAKATRLRAG